MKKARFFLVFVVFLLSFPTEGFGVLEDWALNVEIQPETPTIYGPITFISSAISGSGPVMMENTLFQINGTKLKYGMYLSVGLLTVVTPWSYTENIGTLPSGTYDLTATANYIYDDGFITSEKFFTSFQVIPEPCTLLVSGLGGLALRLKRSQ